VGEWLSGNDTSCGKNTLTVHRWKIINQFTFHYGVIKPMVNDFLWAMMLLLLSFEAQQQKP